MATTAEKPFSLPVTAAINAPEAILLPINSLISAPLSVLRNHLQLSFASQQQPEGSNTLVGK